MSTEQRSAIGLQKLRGYAAKYWEIPEDAEVYHEVSGVFDVQGVENYLDAAVRFHERSATISLEWDFEAQEIIVGFEQDTLSATYFLGVQNPEDITFDNLSEVFVAAESDGFDLC